MLPSLYRDTAKVPSKEFAILLLFCIARVGKWELDHRLLAGTFCLFVLQKNGLLTTMRVCSFVSFGVIIKAKALQAKSSYLWWCKRQWAITIFLVLCRPCCQYLRSSWTVANANARVIQNVAILFLMFMAELLILTWRKYCLTKGVIDCGSDTIFRSTLHFRSARGWVWYFWLISWVFMVAVCSFQHEIWHTVERGCISRSEQIH